MEYFLPTIAAQIALSAPDRREKLKEIFDKDPHIANRVTGALQLLVNMFHSEEAETRTPEEPSPSQLVIIDGLDECKGNDAQLTVLTVLRDLIVKHCLPLRCLVVSRPEVHLQHSFNDMAQITDLVSLYGDYRAIDDVSKFLKTEFSRIHDSKRHVEIMRSVPKPWPSEDVRHKLALRSSGYFIFAATVAKYVDEEYFSPLERLDQVLTVGDSTSPQTGPFAELDKMYYQVLSTCSKPELLKTILGFIFFFKDDPNARHYVYLPLTPLEQSLGLHSGEVLLTFQGLHSIFSFSSSKMLPTPTHASFGDFFLDKTRSGKYHIEEVEWRRNTLRRLLLSAGTVHSRLAQPSFMCVHIPQ